MDFEYDSYIMGKLDPNLLLLLVAGAGGLWFYFKGGGREMLQGMMPSATPPAAAVSPDKDVPPDPKAVKEEEKTPEPTREDAEEEWDDGKGNIYIIYVDGWMGINNRRMYPPDHEMWEHYYRMRKHHWRYRRCLAKYRNASWCKMKHKYCVGPWKNTPWCRGFRRGYPVPPSDDYYWDDSDRPPYGREHPKPPNKPPRTPPVSDTNNCPPFIFKNGKKYRFTRDPMPDVMPAIFPPPYIKEGNCVYKLDNNQGGGNDGRSGWDGSPGGGPQQGQGNWWDKIGDFLGGKSPSSFYTYSRIGNM